jgi:hypothetical protein
VVKFVDLYMFLAYATCSCTPLAGETRYDDLKPPSFYTFRISALIPGTNCE